MTDQLAKLKHELETLTAAVAESRRQAIEFLCVVEAISEHVDKLKAKLVTR